MSTFTVKGHADNHFYKYIYLFWNIMQYEISFFIVKLVKIFKFDLNVKRRSYLY